MPNGDPLDRFFYPTLTLMIDPYITSQSTAYGHVGTVSSPTHTFFLDKLD